MILTDRDIKERIALGEMAINNMVDVDKQLQPCSVELSSSEKIQISPNSFKNIIANEYVKIPNDVMARTANKSSKATKGIMIIPGNLYDPGYIGPCYSTVYNMNPYMIVVEKDERFCQLIFEELSGVPDRIYGEANNNHQHGRNR